jgi:rubrerythrin
MNVESHGVSIILMLTRHEEVIGSLYNACSLRFPDTAKFWQTLVLEEKAHADVLRTLEKQLATQKVVLNHRKFNVTGIQTAINHVEKQKQNVEKGSVNLLQALAMALDIERAIIDRDFFEVFESDSFMMKREFNELRKHTSEHIGRITAKLEECRNQPGIL